MLQSESAQSIAPSQSLSRPSPQVVSGPSGGAPFPLHTEQVPPAAAVEQMSPFAPQALPAVVPVACTSPDISLHCASARFDLNWTR